VQIKASTSEICFIQIRAHSYIYKGRVWVLAVSRSGSLVRLNRSQTSRKNEWVTNSHRVSRLIVRLHQEREIKFIQPQPAEGDDTRVLAA
jgi:hypothetical protein